jgi:hypothetical protein
VIKNPGSSEDPASPYNEEFRLDKQKTQPKKPSMRGSKKRGKKEALE